MKDLEKNKSENTRLLLHDLDDAAINGDQIKSCCMCNSFSDVQFS